MSSASTSKAAAVRQLLAKRATQHRIIKENTKKLKEIEEQYANRTGRKPKEYHALAQRIEAAEKVLKGVHETLVDELVETEVHVRHAEVHVRHAAPAGRSAAARAQDAEDAAQDAEDAAVLAEAAAISAVLAEAAAISAGGDDDDGSWHTRRSHRTLRASALPSVTQCITKWRATGRRPKMC